MKPNDPRYEIAPGMFNWSAYSRENIPKGPPAFAVGDRVVFTQPLYIHRVSQDCDGEPLFAVGMENPADLTDEELSRGKNYWILLHGWSKDSFRLATPEEIQ